MRGVYINSFDAYIMSTWMLSTHTSLDAIESILLDTANIVDGCEIIICADFNARTEAV